MAKIAPDLFPHFFKFPTIHGGQGPSTVNVALDPITRREEKIYITASPVSPARIPFPPFKVNPPQYK